MFSTQILYNQCYGMIPVPNFDTSKYKVTLIPELKLIDGTSVVNEFNKNITTNGCVAVQSKDLSVAGKLFIAVLRFEDI